MPELVERRVDLPLLIHYILRRLCATRGFAVPDVSPNTMEILLNYTYPGNIRELENILEHAIIICQENKIQPACLPDYLYHVLEDSTGQPNECSAPEERAELLAELNRHKWHKAETARALGIDRTTLWRKMKKYGL